MTQKYRDEILKFLSCCLDIMFQYDKNVIVIEQDKPEIGRVYESIKEYKTHSHNFIDYRTGLSNNSYKILYDNIVNWLEDIYPINVLRDDSTCIRIQFNSKNFKRDAIEMAIEHLKQKIKKEDPLTFDKDTIRNIDRTDLKVPEQEKKEERIAMIKYSEAEAERIINIIINPVLAVLAKGPYSLIVFPTTNKGYAPVYRNLEDWNNNKRNARDWSHSYNWNKTDITEAIYTLFRHNLSYWIRDNLNIKICVLNDDRIRIRFANYLTTEQKIYAVKALVAEIKNSISYPDPHEMPIEVKEERSTMIDYTMDTAEKVVNAFVSPCLGNMLDPDWEPDVIILPKKRNGVGYIFNDLDRAKKCSIDEQDKQGVPLPTYVHGIASDTVYKTLFDNVGKWVQAIPEIKVCHLKDGNLRIRFEEGTTLSSRTQAVQRLKQTIRQNVNIGSVGIPLPCIDEKYEKYKEKKGEEKRMNSFSLTNLKDALVNKITHLDKKTITILALIALVLLVVGKYQDIKDILVGIKDKVKRSKNFKAMVADGTAAIDSLKKIVGVKDNKETTNEA